MKGYNKVHNMKIDLNNSKELKEAVGYFEDVVNIKEVLERFVEELVLNGADYAKKTCPRDTGNLENGIYYEVKPLANGVRGSVVCKSDHAAYVEFGTGVVGEAFAYPGDLDGYQRNVPSQQKDSTGGWTYKGDDGNFHYTHGQVPKPFMYQTAKYMEGIAPNIAKGILNGK